MEDVELIMGKWINGVIAATVGIGVRGLTTMCGEEMGERQRELEACRASRRLGVDTGVVGMPVTAVPLSLVLESSNELELMDRYDDDEVDIVEATHSSRFVP
eukprot:CAMPEP_0172322580 /NCGR_PEP_ID=MMETSP1058-20130122/46301_1 /TAXON_ID=83371 /ORGANISM="Detonula confervacea, Strain CCMP 353" /LENGTH=101 /DNA_ID=CAMNT_0013038355 /DNA_START=411 /DNA_END=717 /DNA_ORIENTATION=-